MDTVAVLLLTIWLSNGEVTARAIMAPSMEECVADRDKIVMVFSASKAFTTEGRQVKIKHVQGFCHEADPNSI